MFPAPRMREIVDYLHKHDQLYGMFHHFHVSVIARRVTVWFQI